MGFFSKDKATYHMVALGLADTIFGTIENDAYLDILKKEGVGIEEIDIKQVREIIASSSLAVIMGLEATKETRYTQKIGIAIFQEIFERISKMGFDPNEFRDFIRERHVSYREIISASSFEKADIPYGEKFIGYFVGDGKNDLMLAMGVWADFCSTMFSSKELFEKIFSRFEFEE